MKSRFSFILVAIAIISATLLVAQESTAITREALVKMFANIKETTQWNMDGPMLWGYFFTNRTREPLVVAAKELEKEGYRMVEIRRDEGKDFWWLHVEKVEVHSVDSLSRRNAVLYKFASDQHLTAYDGMDVGPVPGEKKG